MIKVLFGILVVLSLSVPVDAVEIVAPEVPESGRKIISQKWESFDDALQELTDSGTELFLSEWKVAAQTSTGVILAAVMCSLLPIITKSVSSAVSIVYAVTLSAMMFRHTGAMITCASEAVREICEYGKLLCPVLATALAAQGGITASAVLYTGTTAFLAVLNMLVIRIIVPMVYLFLLFSVSHCALNDEIMKKLADTIKNFLAWLLKSVLIVFTTYMSITGVVSGTTDFAALKATKVTISSVVPVVGGILSDASESVVASMAVMKNAAGTYGIVAVLAVFLGPFIKIGIQYLLLKVSAAICALFADKSISSLVESFSAAMGLLASMVAACGISVLFSTVCFMKGSGL